MIVTAKSNVGKVYRGETKYIDPETKKQRNYVVVRDNGKAVSVAKLKSIKKERDPALMEIDQKKYGLEKRTGVDYQRFGKNRMTKRPLDLSDKKVFPEQKERFKLSSHDTYNAIVHTRVQKKKRPR
ncbi:MAG: hypothetical protein E7585_01780 [Ruminococcaceae bacterium]|nr:hypothetical protein [Oscillospiraceae bacterium]